MAHIVPHSLLTLEAYARQRGEFRARVIEHKKRRTVRLGAHLTLTRRVMPPQLGAGVPEIGRECGQALTMCFWLSNG